MMITEPATTLTDYAIAVESLIFTVLLVRTEQSHLQRSRQLWAATFACVGLAAFLGGTCHGFVNTLGNDVVKVLWQVMLCSIGIASIFMISATVISTLPQRWHGWFLIGISVKTFLYLLWAIQYTHYGYAVADYLSAMLIVIFLEIRAIYKVINPSSAWWILAGICISGVAVGVQGSGLAIAHYLNHNDLYHLVQMIALYLFYRAAICLKDFNQQAIHS